MSNQNNTALTVKNTRDIFSRESTITKFQQLIGPSKTPGFIASVMQVVSTNDLLAKADSVSIFQAAAMAAALDLPINQNLGFAYIVPYGGKAQFQIGWKGFIQLAQRSGQFKSINATPIYKGQLLGENPLTGEYTFDFTVAKSGDAVGYAAYFRLLNGFEKIVYMSREEIIAHATKFSQTYKKGFGVWKDNFDAMALKTVTKLMLNKYAPLSTDMQTAVKADQAVINDAEDADFEYIDNPVNIA